MTKKLVAVIFAFSFALFAQTRVVPKPKPNDQLTPVKPPSATNRICLVANQTGGCAIYDDGTTLSVEGKRTVTTQFDVKCSGNITDTLQTAVNALTSANGGTVRLSSGSCYSTAKTTISFDGATGKQKSVRITGQGAGASGKWMGGSIPSAATQLDLRYTSTTGKIETLGEGLLEIDHIQFTDTVDGTTPFIYTTNTTLRIHDNSFIGKRGPTSLTITVTKGSSTSIAATAHGMATGGYAFIKDATGDWAGLNGLWAVTRTDAGNFTIAVDSSAYTGSFNGAVYAMPQQDAIVLGGTTAVYSTDPDAGFQGYGTVIESNYFEQIQRGVYFRVYANAAQVVNNTFWQQCGGIAPFEFAYGAGGNYIAGNLIEVANYGYTAKLTNATNNVFVGNGIWVDPSDSRAYTMKYLLTASTDNVFVGNTGPTGTTNGTYGDADWVKNQFVAEPGPYTWGPQLGGYGDLAVDNMPFRFYGNGAGDSGLRHYASRGTKTTPTSTDVGDILGAHDFYGYAGGTSTYKRGASLRVLAQTGDAGAIGGGFLFSTTPAGPPTWGGDVQPRFSIGFYGEVVSYQAVNYIATEGGANNAITGTLKDAAGNNVTLAAGLRVTVKLAHTLQVGANTFNLNAGGAVDIKSHRNPVNNIAVAYAVGGLIELMYDGTVWQDMSQ